MKVQFWVKWFHESPVILTLISNFHSFFATNTRMLNKELNLPENHKVENIGIKDKLSLVPAVSLGDFPRTLRKWS